MTILCIIGIVAVPLALLALIRRAERNHINFIESLGGILTPKDE